MDNIVTERAQQLFLLADKERKGFIVKRDMQHMRSEVPLSPDQLEAVFDSLDVQGNRYLTMHQFLSGFGEHISVDASSSVAATEDRVYSSDGDEDISLAPGRSLVGHQQLDGLLSHLEQEDFFSGLQQVCLRTQLEGGPNFLQILVTFLQQLGGHVSRNRTELATLQQTCRDKEESHRTQMLKLCEDFDKQMKDHEQLSSKEELRAALMAARLSQELQRRDKQLAELQEEHQQMAACVYELKTAVAATQLDKDKLMASKMELECDLQKSSDRCNRLQRYLEAARLESSRDRHKYVSLGFQLARSMLVEQQGLRRQLHLLECISASLETAVDGRQQEASINYPEGQDCCAQCTGAADDLTCLDYEYDEDFHKTKCDQLAGDAASTAAPCLQEELQQAGPTSSGHVASQQQGLETNSTTAGCLHDQFT